MPQILSSPFEPIKGTICTGPVIVVAKDGVNSQRRLQLRQDRPNSVYFPVGISAMYKVPGADDHISSKAVGFMDDITDKGFRNQTIVQVSKMNNGETVELQGKVGNRNPIAVYLNPITLSKQVSDQRQDSKAGG